MAKLTNKNSKNKTFVSIPPEYLFAVLGLIFGLFFVFINPPFQTNDEDRHFIHSYILSQGFFLPDQGKNKIGAEIPLNIIEIPKRFQGIRFSKDVKISKQKLEEAENIPLYPHNNIFYHDFHHSLNPIGFIPAATGIGVGQYINSNPVWLGWFGRIGSLIFYIVIIFFAIRLTPILKNAFMLYALTPMVLYQGSSVTYDVLSFSLAVLFLALVLKYALEENSFIGWRELILLIAVMVLQRFAKDGYPLIPFLFLMIPMKKVKLKVKPIIIYAAMFIFSYLLFSMPSWTWGKILSSQHYHQKTSEKLQKDFGGNWHQNLDINLEHPGTALSNLGENLDHFRQEWTAGTIGRFGYSYTLLPNWFYFIHGLILLFVAFYDSNKKIVLQFYQKTIAFIIGFGSIAGIMVMNYLYSPVGAKQIFGLQGRYFANAIPVLLLLLYNNKFENFNWKKWGSYIVGVYVIFALTYTLIYLNDIFYSLP